MPTLSPKKFTKEYIQLYIDFFTQYFYLILSLCTIQNYFWCNYFTFKAKKKYRLKTDVDLAKLHFRCRKVKLNDRILTESWSNNFILFRTRNIEFKAETMDIVEKFLRSDIECKDIEPPASIHECQEEDKKSKLQWFNDIKRRLHDLGRKETKWVRNINSMPATIIFFSQNSKGAARTF